MKKQQMKDCYSYNNKGKEKVEGEESGEGSVVY